MLTTRIIAAVLALVLAAAAAYAVGSHRGHHTPAAACDTAPHLIFTNRDSGQKTSACLTENTRVLVAVTPAQWAQIRGIVTLSGSYNLDTADPHALVAVNGHPVVLP